MLNSVEVRNAVGTLVQTLPIKSVSASSHYVIEEITGLDPVKADITSSDYATQDGGFFQSARAGGRNLIFKMAYQPDYVAGKTVETLRREMYSIFPPKGAVFLRFFNSDPLFKTVEIKGWVESFSSPPFAKEPAINVSIICPKPNFYELAPVTKLGDSGTIISMPYEGDAEVGFTLRVNPLTTIQRLVLKNGVDKDLDLRFQAPIPGTPGWVDPFAPTFLDTITFSTLPGNKYINLVRQGVTYNLMPYIKSGSLSMKLSPLVKTIQIDIGQSSVPGSDVPADWGWTTTTGMLLTCTPEYLGL